MSAAFSANCKSLSSSHPYIPNTAETARLTRSRGVLFALYQLTTTSNQHELPTKQHTNQARRSRSVSPWIRLVMRHLHSRRRSSRSHRRSSRPPSRLTPLPSSRKSRPRRDLRPLRRKRLDPHNHTTLSSGIQGSLPNALAYMTATVEDVGPCLLPRAENGRVDSWSEDGTMSK
jgi:hypothetical protein